MRAVLLVLLLASCTTQRAEEVTLDADQYGRAVQAAYERGYWAGWRQHAIVVGGGL